MSNTVSAKILRKKVDDGSYGTKRYSFYIAYQGKETWVSAFADPKKMTPEVIETLKGLGEGDRGEFTLVENPGKDGKVYMNIVGAVRETDVRDDVPATSPSVQPSGRAKTGHPGDTPDSMVLSYSKDGAIKMTKEGDTPDEFVRKVFIIYGGLKAILAGVYSPEPKDDETPF